MTTELLLGIDVGTTFCKATVVSLEGRELAHGRARTPWRAVPTGAELDPRALIEVSLEAARAAITQVPGGRVIGIGVTSMAETGALIDEHGEPVAPAIAWHDARGEDEARQLATELGEERFMIRTGLPVSRLCTLSKYRWLLAHHTEAKRGRRWLNVSEWVVYGLGGEQFAELSLASRTGFLDLQSRSWWDEALSWAGAPSDLLPSPVPAGTPMGRIRPGLVEGADGAVLSVGGHDHPCASVGAGAIDPGDLFDSNGTAEALVRAVRPPVTAEQMLRAIAGGVTIGWHVVPGYLALQGGFLSGKALQRFLDLLGCDESGRAALDAAAMAAPAGAAGLAVECVVEDRAALTGIGWDVSPGLVWRAALEAVARHAAGIRKTIEAIAGSTERLVVTGGWARSEAVRNVKWEILGPFEYPPVREAGARGAALLAGIAAGVYSGVEQLPPPA